MTLSPKTSVSLILKVASQQDVLAWERFCEIYQPLVYRIALSRGLQAADAHDLVQEVMTRVARSIANWDPDSSKGSFRGWISRIARNLIIDFMRNKNRLPITSDHSDIRKMIESTPAESKDSQWLDLEYEKQVFIAAANQIKHKFNEKTWQAFWLTAVENNSVESTATLLSMTPGSIYVARSRVMAKLKETVRIYIEGSE